MDKLPFFDYKGTKLHYKEIDGRPKDDTSTPLVFVHGAGSSIIIWTLQLLEFGKRRRVIALDLSGHGESEKTEQTPSIDGGYVKELAALIEYLALEDFILVGHSMGGGVAMSYALREEFLAPKALVLVDTSSNLDLSKVMKGLVIEAVEMQITKLRIKDLEKESDSYSLARFQKMALKIDPKTILPDLRACDSFDLTDRLGEIDIPVFVIVGEDDDIITPQVAKSLETALPKADIAVIKDANHAPMLEQPETFNSLLEKYLNWVDSTV
ncbi:MAG: alpha/beta fold hydrolase [Candidatus Thorarchaeota archaeon]